MLCVNPFRVRPGVEHGCGQCMVCRLNRRREWTARIVLESAMYPTSTFATLTYSELNVPGNGSLSREHWREFSKGIGYRYFGVGEYGERSWRPHYHVVLFGLDPYQSQAFLADRWDKGFIHVGADVTIAVARYLAAYTTKKLTRLTEATEEKLAGRLPEFARMSRRPAIGWPGVQFMVRWLATPVGQAWMAERRDVPNAVQIGKGVYPLGRTLVGKLRELLDVDPQDPVRREAREGMLRVIHLDPLLKSERERMRYGRYDTLKARSAVNRRPL